MTFVANIQCPEYPVISWKPTITGSVNFIYDPGGIPVSKNVYFSSSHGSDYWGFASSGSSQPELCDSQSIQGKFCSELEDFFVTDCSISNAQFSGSYSWSGFGWPKWTIHGSGSIVENTLVAFDSVETARQFGFNSASFAISSLNLTKTSDFNSVGYWAPRQRTVYDDRHTANPDVYTSVSIYGNNYKTVPWGANKQMRRLEFPFVRPPYMYTYRSLDFAFADPAGRNDDDSNNNYQNLIESARDLQTNNSSRQYRIYHSDGKYRIGYMVDQVAITDSSTNQESISSRAAYWNVAIYLRDEPGSDGAI